MPEFVAALPMYDWPETAAETDAAWGVIRERLRGAGIAAPERVARCNADLPAVPGGIRDVAGRMIAPDPATLPPDALELPTLFRHPALLFAQTCWGPMEQGLAEHVTVLGQPDYSDFEGGEGPLYASAILTRASLPPVGRSRFGVVPPLRPAFRGPPFPPVGEEVDREAGGSGRTTSPPTTPPPTSIPERRQPIAFPNAGASPSSRRSSEQADRIGSSRAPILDPPLIEALRGKRFAYNSLDSMSGLIAFSRDLEAIGESLEIFSERIETGAHRSSVVAVARGDADVCAVDCRTWDLAKRFEPLAGGLQVVGWTARRPGLPFVTARRTPPETVAAMRKALQGPPSSLASSG